MFGQLFPLSPGCASLTEGYAHLATPWQRNHYPVFQPLVQLFGKIVLSNYQLFLKI